MVGQSEGCDYEELGQGCAAEHCGPGRREGGLGRGGVPLKYRQCTETGKVLRRHQDNREDEMRIVQDQSEQFVSMCLKSNLLTIL